MVRTTVYMDEETALAIRHLAKTLKKSQAEVIREALKKQVKQALVKAKRPPIKGVGAYQSGRSDVSERIEEILWAAARKPE